MATTGIKEGTSSAGTAVFATSFFSSSGTVVFANSGHNSEITGFSGTIDGDVVGVKVYLIGVYKPLTTVHDVRLKVSLSFDGGSSYTEKVSPELEGGAITPDDIVMGAEDELPNTSNGWSSNLDLSSFTDLSNIRLRGTNNPFAGASAALLYGNHAEIEIFYTKSGTTKVISSGRLKLKGGKLKIV